MTDVLAAGSIGGTEVSEVQGLFTKTILHKGVMRKLNMTPGQDIYKNEHTYIRQVPCDAGYSTALQNAQLVYNTLIKKASFGQVQHLFLKITITAGAAAVRMAPVPMWIDMLEFYGSGSGDLIQRFYPEPMLMSLMSMPTEIMSDLGHILNITPTFTDHAVDELAIGAVHDFYLPLFSAFPEQSSIGFNFGAIFQDIQMRITWATRAHINNSQSTTDGTTMFSPPKGGVTAANAATPLTVSDLQLVAIESHDVKKELELASMAIGVRYLEAINMTQNVVMTNATQTTVNLDRLQGMAVSYFMMGLRRASFGATENAQMDGQMLKFMDLGRGGTIALLDSAGNSQLSAVPIDETILTRLTVPIMAPSSMTDMISWYILSPSSDFLGDMKGGCAGMFLIDSTNYRLAITPCGITGVAQIQTFTNLVTLNNAAAATDYITVGYTSKFTGSYSETQPFLANASIQAVKALIEALPSVRDDKMSVYLGAPFTTAPVVITCWGAGVFEDFPLLNIKGSKVAGTDVLIYQGVATAATRGFPSPAAGTGTYQLMLYAMVQTRVAFCNGVWESKHLGFDAI